MCWKAFSEDERKRIYTEYAQLDRAPGITPGVPLGLPKDAKTVRVRDGRNMKSRRKRLQPE